MAYGDAKGPGYAEGTPTARLAARDLGRAQISSVDVYVQEVTHEITSMGSLIKQVTTPGTEVRLSASSLPVRRVIIQRLESNTGLIVVGDSNVVAALGTQASPTRRGFTLASANDWIEFNFDDLTDIWIDALYANDGVSVVYWT